MAPFFRCFPTADPIKGVATRKPARTNFDDGASQRLRILAIGPAFDGTSYSRVVENTLANLEYCEIVHLAVNCRDVPAAAWRARPNPRVGDRYGLIEAASIADEVAPDVVYVFNSFSELPRYAPLKETLAQRCILVAQCPLLGEVVDPFLIGRLAFFDCLAVLSEGVRRHFETCLKICYEAGRIDRVPDLAVIPHGFDASVFRRIDSREIGHFRREHFGVGPAGFIVLNANRNEPRKRLDVTLKGFAKFARDKPGDVRLYLHMADPNGALRAMAEALGVGARVMISGCERHPALSDKELNQIYNACDVGLNTASGEGWGMIAFEHAAAGAPQLVPGHGVCAEIWADAAEILPAVEEAVTRRYTKEYVVTADSVAAALERLYSDSAWRADLAVRGRANASRAEFQWHRIGREWGQLFRDLAFGAREAEAKPPIHSRSGRG
jgi:D-inositol-3-phosphate glycosyltransferase